MRQRSLVVVIIFLLSCLAFSQRLPQLAVPENYVLTFTPNFDNDTFTGQESIRIRILKPTDVLVLNAAEIHFQDASITSVATTQKAKVSLDKKTEMATLKFEKSLQPGLATIQIRYLGILNTELRGFYLGKLEGGKKYAVTQFESTDARRAFPSFDEPAYKATFDITIITDKGLTAISNGRIVSDTPGPGPNQHTVHFATTAKMSTYLVAMAIGDFEYIEGSADGIPIRVYGPPGSKSNSTYALRMGEECVRYYDQYFGIKYPFQKLDMIGIPDFAAGAMENTGLITYREAMLQLDDEHASVRKHKDVAVYIAHEIAHQWFGDLVTMKWWDDIWLNEGFATWMETKAVGALRPEWNMNLDEVRDTIDALNLDSLQSTRPVHQAAETPAQIQELFDGIAYDKAGAVLRMVESYLGPQTFRAGVDEYLKEYSYANATAQDFWNTLTTVSKKPVDQVMASFVTQPGAPMVTLDVQCKGNSARVTLSQQRYFYDQDLFRGDNDQLWQVPVCMKEPAGGSGKQDQECVLLTGRKETFPVPQCAPWIFTNAGATGYYRSGYETEMLRAMASDLESRLTPAERIMLLGSAWASVRVGRQQIGDFLALAEGLEADRNRAVMSQLADQIDYISAYLVDSDDRESFELWVRRLLTPAAKDFGWQSKPGEDDEQKSLRARILQTLGSAGRDPDVLAQARKLTDQALQNPGSMDRTLEKTAFTLAAQNGDAGLYNAFFDRMTKAQSREEYYLYLGTLTQFSDPKLLHRTLQYTMTDEVRTQDRLGLIAGILQNPAGQKEAWDFVRAHWSELDKVGSGFISGELVHATSAFCDVQLRDEVKDFFSSHKVPVAERTLKQSLERINNCVDLKSQQGGNLAAWLQQRGAASGQ